jgi:hypothetical protein
VRSRRFDAEFVDHQFADRPKRRAWSIAVVADSVRVVWTGNPARASAWTTQLLHVLNR